MAAEITGRQRAEATYVAAVNEGLDDVQSALKQRSEDGLIDAVKAAWTLTPPDDKNILSGYIAKQPAIAMLGDDLECAFNQWSENPEACARSAAVLHTDAFLYKLRGKNEDAMTCLRRELRILKRCLGEDSPIVHNVDWLITLTEMPQLLPTVKKSEVRSPEASPSRQKYHTLPYRRTENLESKLIRI